MTTQFNQELDDQIYMAQSLDSVIREFEGKTILLLGGSGFLGTAFKIFFLYLNEKVLHVPCKIITVDNYIKGTTTLNEEITAPNLYPIHHNIILPIQEKLGARRIDFIINCSGNASPKQYERFPYETIDVSVAGVRNTLALAVEHGARVVNFSSSEVLGTPPDDEIPTTELSPARLHALNRRAPYDVSKLMIETLSFLSKERGADCKVIRPFNVIGYFNKDDFRVIPNYFKKVLAGQPIEVYEPGTQTRTFCFYSDFIIGTILVLLSAGDEILYHIGNSENEITMVDLANRVANICGRPDLVSMVPTPLVYKTEPRRRCPSIEKARKLLGYHPKVNIDQMLNKIHLWAKLTY